MNQHKTHPGAASAREGVVVVERLRGDALMNMRARVLMESPLCPECLKRGIVDIGVELDHIKPLHLGGGNERANLQLLCISHHLAKTAKEMGHKPRGALADGTPVDEDHPWNSSQN